MRWVNKNPIWRQIHRKMKIVIYIQVYILIDGTLSYHKTEMVCVITDWTNTPCKLDLFNHLGACSLNTFKWCQTSYGWWSDHITAPQCGSGESLISWQVMYNYGDFQNVTKFKALSGE